MVSKIFLKLWLLSELFLRKAEVVKVSLPLFSYHGDGCPALWYKTFPDCNSKSRQSPIDIETDSKIPIPRPIHFQNHQTHAGKQWTLERTHTGLLLNHHPISPSLEAKIIIEGEVYSFVGAHFHWGPGGTGSRVGSEHSFNGRFFPLESHTVYKSQNGDTFQVLAVLYQLKYHDNAYISPLLDVLMKEISKPDYNYTGGQAMQYLTSPFNLHDLTPDQNSWNAYYSYEGSFTTPPCTENLIFNVIEKLSFVSRDQMNIFYQLRQCDSVHNQCFADKYIGPNNRPTQFLNARKIHRYSKNPNRYHINNQINF